MMYTKQLIICTVLCCVSQVIGNRESKISATILESYPDDLDTSPFTKLGNKFYNFGQSKVSWYKAHLICRSMGGYLASFDNQKELTELSEHLKTKYPTDRWWWISGSDLQGEGDFYWYRTGERITYADWSAGQPDNAGGHENCVHLWFITHKFQMNDWECHESAYYICEANKPNTVVVTVF